MNYKNIISDFLGRRRIFLVKRKTLIVFLGSFGDFDSFEYSQQLSAQSNMLSRNSIDLILIGIGSEKSKEMFCKFNNLNYKSVLVVSNADLHKKLSLNEGFVSPMPAIINLLIMCAGISSKGTIKEVLRGYFGDKNAKCLFSPEEDIKIGAFSLFKGKIFETFSKKQILRPFELATRRLMNMIEILSHWNTYVPDSSYLTQRGATFLLNENDKVMYKFIPDSLLGYSFQMSRPLSFLDDFLN